ncbi:unnamed protein product [Brassica rapa subsp. narinosa]
MAKKLNKPTSPTPSSPPQKRKTKLASSQLFPFRRKLYREAHHHRCDTVRLSI